MEQAQSIGITATLPMEAVFAAGLVPADLNNLFVSSPDAAGLVERAERSGMPQNTCAWIKGIYSALHESGIRKVVGVTGGDCTNTRGLLEIWESEGVETLEFSYPYPADESALALEIEKLCAALGTTVGNAEKIREDMTEVRSLAAEVDRLTWEGCRVTGGENHNWLVGTSDFCGDYHEYKRKLGEFVEEAASRPERSGPRIGILGVPPILSDLHDFIEDRGAVVVFNEFQRQFSMPFPAGSLAEQYSLYTYPYDTERRMADVKKEIRRRSIDGIINYVQNFCWRQITDRLVRASAGAPVLTLQADKPGKVSGPAATRIEAFLEMIED